MPSDTHLEGKASVQERVHKIIETFGKRDISRVARVINALPASRIATLIAASPPSQRQILRHVLNDDLEADVLPLLPPAIRNDWMRGMDVIDLSEVIARLDPDEVNELVGNLPQQLAHEILESMSIRDRERVRSSLSWPSDSVGSLMNTAIPTLQGHETVQVVLQYLRSFKISEHLDILPVVSKDGVYLGVIPVNELLSTERHTSIRRLIRRKQAIAADASLTDLPNIVEEMHQSICVIDGNGALLGMIERDRLAHMQRNRSDESLRKTVNVDADTFQPALPAMINRFYWLALNLATAFLAASVIDIFSETLDKVLALAVLTPVVASMGGIATTQTLTLTIRGMTLNQLDRSNLAWLTQRELLVAIGNGVALSGLIIVVVLFWFDDLLLGTVLSMAMLLNLVVAVLSGLSIPFIMRKVGIDPAVSGAVVATTLTDCFGFATFLGLATYFYL